MDKAKERLQRIIRTERYANKVKQLFFDTVNEITALSKSLPVLEEGVMFSFEGENRKKQLQVERALRKLHSFATVAIEQGIDLEWEEANKTCDELLSTQFGKASLQSPFFKAWALRNHDVRDAFAKRVTGGMNLSQRIWKYVDQFRDEMEIAMTVAITEGESASEMSRKVRQYLQDPDLMFRRFRYKTGEDADGNPIYGKKWKKKVRDDNGNVRWIDYDKDSYEVGKGMYKSAYKNAMRVARTETNMAYRKADNVRWQQMDFVTGQRISLSKKHPCEDICDDLAGDYPKSFVFTGWHPQCFCYVTPILGDEDEMAKITDAFLEGKDYEPQFEQLEEYPKGFEKWVKDHKKQINKSIKQGKEPYFVKDNRKAIEGIIGSKNRMQVKLLNSSLNSLDYNRASDLKIINLELGNKSSISNQEVIGIINEIDKTNPELFKGRLKEVKIINTKKGFMAFDRTSGVLNISDNAFTTLNDGEFAPLKELKGAFAKIATHKKNAILSFNQEYALECLWHEIRHASALGWKDISNKTAELTNTMELINQFCARKSYKKLVQSLGGKTAHEKKIMEKGYGYNNSIQNFCFLLKEINVSQKSAYTHFKDMIINKPYENIYDELIKFISEKGKIRKEEVNRLVNRFGYLHKEFKLFYNSMNA